MAGIISSFLSSAKLVIHIDGRAVAYATNLSISDRMSVAPVGGIGAYSADALEPLQYSVSGSFAITIYDEATLKAVTKLGKLPERASAHVGTTNYQGNSHLSKNSFSPLHLLISRTIDIDVYEKIPTAAAYAPAGSPADKDMTLTYKIHDVRLTSYSLTFTPGSLLQEQIGFIAMKMEDMMASAVVYNSPETK